jgi:hypothetical protein
LELKTGEYSRDDDRLYNFKRAAAMLRCSPERALLGFVTKHIVSLMDMIDDIDSGNLADDKLWDEKIGDIILYMILLRSLIVERRSMLEEQKNNTLIDGDQMPPGELYYVYNEKDGVLKK